MYFSDLVYSDTNENWFSPHGWPERQLHPGMGMHIVSTWIFAYHLLHLTGTLMRMGMIEVDMFMIALVMKEC